MPIYEYRCNKCEEVFEVKQSFSDSPLTEHEGCGGTVERLISPPALQFKGSGWYITDYARANGSGKKNGAETKTSETKADSGKSESKSESSSKPSTSTETKSS